MRRVYVAGAYSADNVIDVLKNIGRGERMAARVYRAGMYPFCQWHDKSYIMAHPDANHPVEQLQAASMSWLEVSHCVMLVPGYENSKGTKAEIARAKEIGIPVFDNFGDLVQFFFDEVANEHS